MLEIKFSLSFFKPPFRQLFFNVDHSNEMNNSNKISICFNSNLLVHLDRVLREIFLKSTL